MDAMFVLFRFVVRVLGCWLRLLSRLWPGRGRGGGRCHGWRRWDGADGGRGRCVCQRKPDWVAREVIKLAALAHRRTGCRTVALLFNRRFAAGRGVTVGKTYVADVLRRHRAELSRVRERFKRRVPADMRANVIWGMDLTGKTDAGGDAHQILAVVDHGTRRAVRLCVAARKCSWMLLGHLCFAIAACGKPRVLRTDNEACCCSRCFRGALRLLGIRHQRSALGCPWQNGRVERFFLTLKQKLNLWEVVDADMLGRARRLGTFHFGMTTCVRTSIWEAGRRWRRGAGLPPMPANRNEGNSFRRGTDCLPANSSTGADAVGFCSLKSIGLETSAALRDG